MYVVCVDVWIKPDREADFIEAVRKNAEGTRREAGNLRFDVLQNNDEPSRFFLYEVYKSEDDFRTHQQTAHYLGWRETVGEMMERPREGRKYTACFPDISRFDSA